MHVAIAIANGSVLKRHNKNFLFKYMDDPELYVNKLEKRITELENTVKVLKEENNKLSSNFIVSIASDSQSETVQELRNKIIQMEKTFESSVNEYKRKLILKDLEIQELKRNYESNSEIPYLVMERKATSSKNTPLRCIQQSTLSERGVYNKPYFYGYKSLVKLTQKDTTSQAKKKIKNRKQPIFRKNSQHYIPSFMKLAKFNKL